MPYSGSMVILSNVDNFRNVTTKAQCQANVHGKHGQLKFFGKDKTSANVMLGLREQIC